MKKIGKVLLGILGLAYAAVAIFLTACLLKYNDYKITEFGDTSLIIVDNNELNPEFDKGSLVIASKADSKNIEIGDKILFYNTYNNQVSLSLGQVELIEKISEKETTYTINGHVNISSEYLVGSVKDAKVYKNLGTVLGLLESRVGFLIIIIFPISLAFLYEIYVLILEVKRSIKEETKKEEK